METGQPFGTSHTPKGCDRFILLSADPVRLSLLTGRYGHHASSLHGKDDFLRHPGARQCNMCPVGGL